MGRGSVIVSYNTCAKLTHSKVTCPGEKVKGYRCGLTGYFRGSTVCKRKPAEEKAKTRRERANQVVEPEEERDGASVG